MGWCHMGWCHMAGDARAAWWYTDLEYVRCLVLKWLQLPGPQHRTSPRSTTPHLSTHHTTISAHITPHLSAHRRTSAHISAHISVHISAHISAHMIPIHFYCLADGEQRASLFPALATCLQFSEADVASLRTAHQVQPRGAFSRLMQGTGLLAAQPSPPLWWPVAATVTTDSPAVPPLIPY